MLEKGCFFILKLCILQAILTYSVDCYVELTPTENGIRLQAKAEDSSRIGLTGVIGKGWDFSNICNGNFEECKLDDKTTLKVTQMDADKRVTRITWISEDTTTVFKDCFDLDVNSSWYGGPQMYNQKRLDFIELDGNDPYVIKKSNNFGVAERYWLNSFGIYIFLNDKVPLFVDQNKEVLRTVCFIAKAQNPYINRNRTILEYDIVTFNNPKTAHLHAVHNYLGRPTGLPNEKVIRNPIWTTWPKHKKFIDDTKVRDFAQSIADHNYGGQLEIDEDWEVCFGSHIFNTDKFPDVNSTLNFIRSLGFETITLWINPFVNDDCQNYSSEGLEKGYFVKNPEGDTRAIWWESDNAHQIDFTNPEAAEWFAQKVRALVTNYGFDGFKFDAGETDYAIPPSQFDYIEDQEDVPNIFTQKYIETVSEFGDLIEARAAWRTQDKPFLIRMLDKESWWGDNNGLLSLITTLIQMNMNGYTMVLPDMVGGNGYQQQPTAELIVRWTQANVFMPALQFGYLPWDYPSDEFDTAELVKAAVNLREKYIDHIFVAMNNSINNGTPVNPPIWWVSDFDKEFDGLGVIDEYLLGESILVAPVYVEGGRSRDIYLPNGVWKDGNTDEIYNGPTYLLNYDAPIDILPFFIRQ